MVVLDAYEHPNGCRLIHLRARERFNGWHQIGCWRLEREKVHVATLTYYNQRAILRPPIRWANQRFRKVAETISVSG